MAADGREEVVMDEDVADIIRSAIREAFPSASSDDSQLDLELLDLAIERYLGPFSYPSIESSPLLSHTAQMT